jgi:predicted transposase/invertase (TIGR01784 family)
MFMDFKTIEDKKLHHAYTFREREDNSELSDIVQIHYIELPKIKELFDKPAAELSEIDFWSILIMAGENKKARLLLNKLTKMQEEMDMANALLNQMSRDQQEWENQIGYERFVHDCISREKYAFMQGEKQGIQQGLQQGEHLAALANAKNLIRMNLGTPEQIAQAVSLPLEQVLALKEEIKAGK